MKFTTVLFDLDGTLMDTNELICESWRHTVGTLTGGEISDDVIRDTLGEILADSMRRLMPDIAVEDALETYRVFQTARFLDRIELFPGVMETLGDLKAAGCKLAIATSRLRGSTERALNHLGIADFFDVTLTADDTPIGKPDPTPIFLTLKKIGSKPEESIFVGDTKHDIEAGRAAGVFTVLVDWSFALPKERRVNNPSPEIRPDAVVETMQDILTLLK